MTYDVEIPGGLAKRHKAMTEKNCSRCGEKIIPPEEYYAIWTGKGSAPKEQIHLKCLDEQLGSEK